MRCDQQRCLICGEVAHFLDMAATGLCKACAPAEIVASIVPPAPDLRAFDEVPELEVTLVLPRADESMWELVEARAS